ncbi:hypothetical protein STEG23_005936, partial [Scotinomys teguina]
KPERKFSIELLLLFAREELSKELDVPPKIYDISNDMTINEGTNVTLTCLATGKPEPAISWRHISPSAKPFENGQYLDIYGITRDQAGEYECSAENDVSFPDVKKVRVVVNYTPVKDINIKN